MERTVLFAAATWVTGVGAWGVGLGYALAPYATRRWQQGYALTQRMQLDGNEAGNAPTPPVEAVDVDSLPAPPLPLDAPTSANSMRSAAPVADGDSMRSADPDSYDDILGPSSDDDDPSQELVSPSRDFGLVRPEDASALLTESQRRRLAPVKSLRRTRRSRKVRVTSPKDDKFVPIVRGARPTTEESILTAYNKREADTLDVQREQGEDYWVDPAILAQEVKAREAAEQRRKQISASTTEKLKKEIAAPYKNNYVGVAVIGIGVIAVLFSLFPELLESNSSPLFPDTL